jgi:CubicO group peptidase (beta-lactamase class C family)
VFAAGERFHYSNLSFALLGAVVEQVSGVGWIEYVTERLLVPLQLKTTTYHPTGRAAEGTSRTPDGRLVPEPAEDTGAMAPAGQLWSTVGDLARWGAFLAAGAPGVLARGTLVEMQTVQSGDPTSQHEGGYGLGHRLLWTPGGTVAGHSGSMPGFLADLQVDPRTGAGAAVLMNATTTARTHETGRLLRQWAAEQVDAAAADDPARPSWGAQPLLARTGGGGASVEDLVGRWYWGNTPYELTPTEHGCCLRRPGSTWHFAAQAPDRFLGLTGYVAGEVLQVRRLGDGRVDALEVATFVLRRISSPG